MKITERFDMHYVKKLKEKVEMLEKKNREVQDVINQFRKHLRIEKFHKDTTIQVSDVQSWLDIITEANYLR